MNALFRSQRDRKRDCALRLMPRSQSARMSAARRLRVKTKDPNEKGASSPSVETPFHGQRPEVPLT
jgi:hypothetical protein